MIDSATFNNLKARVKAECKRRKYTGSVESYGGSSYDYTNAATAGAIVRYEHYTKIADPLSAIDGQTRKPRTRINQADITEMQNTLTTLEGKALTSTSTGCSASCTGLCSSVCSGTCKGSCTGGCGGVCSSNCSGSCSAYCASDCNGDCYTSCYVACASDCTGGCETGCYMGCGGTCTGDCYGSSTVHHNS